MSDLWQRVETQPTDGSKFFLEEGDNCYFAREYVVPIDGVMPTGTKWHELSPANQLVGNFKKDSSKKDTREWYWKTRAVSQFAAELVPLMRDNPTWTFIPVPNHNVETDPDYDPRFDMLFAEVLRIFPEARLDRPIRRLATTEPLHKSTKTRSVEAVFATLKWAGFAEALPGGVIVVDDMITCGTSFKACQRLIRSHHPTVPVCGVFWTKRIHKNYATKAAEPF